MLINTTTTDNDYTTTNNNDNNNKNNNKNKNNSNNNNNNCSFSHKLQIDTHVSYKGNQWPLCIHNNEPRMFVPCEKR